MRTHTNYTNVFPQDTNDRGTIFGGKLFSEVDLTVAQHCHILLRQTDCDDAVTVNASIDYHDKAILGDVIRHESTLIKVGIKSLTFTVKSYAMRKAGDLLISTSNVVFVSRKNGEVCKHNLNVNLSQQSRIGFAQ